MASFPDALGPIPGLFVLGRTKFCRSVLGLSGRSCASIRTGVGTGHHEAGVIARSEF